MKKELTDFEVEQEISRLTSNPHVQLSKQEQRIRYKRRQYLYQLRWHEKHGKELAKQGITMESLKKLETEDEE